MVDLDESPGLFFLPGLKSGARIEECVVFRKASIIN